MSNQEKVIIFNEDENYKLHSKKFFAEIRDEDLGIKKDEPVIVSYRKNNQEIVRMHFVLDQVKETKYEEIPDYLFPLTSGNYKDKNKTGKCYIYLFKRKQ